MSDFYSWQTSKGEPRVRMPFIENGKTIWKSVEVIEPDFPPVARPAAEITDRGAVRIGDANVVATRITQKPIDATIEFLAAAFFVGFILYAWIGID